ncbi:MULTISPECIES: sigma 54-interacting transcriptional regulator [Clostridium]|jgi:PAS domain S-box-containing protein|uniref:Sigma 54-interacting transcriptional regulator n=1 Tax=Clostridium beijerinckii TaxID=1520 RepID=A0AAW3WG97_CLOBE|nr:MULTISPECIES: sigma 54-interacting transcriptional regulator [Clostridium]MBC2460279.1 sigma 54-interacting transcriptional regulator [Clostridium beijerinckii]MBC2477793.1 sigma 54-interacting transcriptional regulator [Clostridium beijerinckii]MCI1625292.1 sigma 54-interacting transcriptional regulator [Clostridium beijerinckii]NOV59532.1 PAS domain S-box-containing protein [Clostridium beijerinckii]NOV72687.1 PAS domain S-box-containing protein [Clostridium beijerinckii]
MFLEECFELIIQNVNEALIVIDKKGIILVINKKAEDMFGISSERNLGKYIGEVLPEIQIPKITKAGKAELSQMVFINGKEIISNRIPIIKDERVEGSIEIFTDITDQKKMQNKINLDKDYIDALLTVMDAFNEWFVVINEKGIITSISDDYKEFLGCDNPIGKKVEDIIENTKMGKVLKTGIADIGGIQEIKGNKMIAMRVPIKKDGKVISAVGKVVFKDISDFHALSKKLLDLEKEVEFYKSKIAENKTAKYSVENIIGHSNKIRKVKDLIGKVANTNSNVLINGESGTGKEMIAHSIHNSSKRYLAPFIKINCASIPAELLESELFGYEEGAFTGAKKGGKKGKFELANGGSIFLDEIGDMNINMQAKILRVIQEREIESIGGSGVKSVDVRIITATNKNLEELVKKGEFREDLYYRLNVVKIVSPPLRERKEDIPALANALRIKIAKRLDVYVEGISKDAIECLGNYDWPGNIRELENVIERAINLLDSNIMIKTEHLSERFTSAKYKRYSDKNEYLKTIVEEVEKEVILECLNRNNWNKNKTAQILGISRAGLYKKIEEFNLKV